MFPSPKRMFLTKGVGVHRHALIAFEFALRDALESCRSASYAEIADTTRGLSLEHDSTAKGALYYSSSGSGYWAGAFPAEISNLGSLTCGSFGFCLTSATRNSHPSP
jgi:hypothetical protein